MTQATLAGLQAKQQLMKALIEFEVVGRPLQRRRQNLQRLLALPFLETDLGLGQRLAPGIFRRRKMVLPAFVGDHIAQSALILEHRIAHHGAHDHGKIGEQPRRNRHQHHPRQAVGEHKGHVVRRLPENKQEDPEDQVTPAHGLDHLAHQLRAKGRAQLLVQGQANDAGRHHQHDQQVDAPEQRLTVEVGGQPQRGPRQEKHRQLFEEQAETFTDKSALQARRLLQRLAAGLDDAVQVFGRHAEQGNPENLRAGHKQAGQRQQAGKRQRPGLQGVPEKRGNSFPERLRTVGSTEKGQPAAAQRAARVIISGVGILWQAAIAVIARTGWAMPGGRLRRMVVTVGLVHCIRPCLFSL